MQSLKALFPLSTSDVRSPSRRRSAGHSGKSIRFHGIVTPAAIALAAAVLNLLVDATQPLLREGCLSG